MVDERKRQEQEIDMRHRKKKAHFDGIVRFGAQWRDDLQAFGIWALALGELIAEEKVRTDYTK